MNTVLLRLVFIGSLLAPTAARAEWISVPAAGPDAADPVLLVGDYEPARASTAPVLVFHHGLGSTRHEWEPLAEAARARGWGTLAYDARGHGDSRLTRKGRAVDYAQPEHGRSPAFWAGLPADLGAVERALSGKGVPPSRIVLVGASIGANAALRAAADGPPPRAVVLLSAGLDYAGLTTADAFPRCRAPALLVAAEPDRYAFHSLLELLKTVPADDPRVAAIRRKDAGPRGAHGTQLFDGKLEAEVLDWVGSTGKRRR
jgi:pimeloyl-ACP methyl ester carboxylesterase